MNVRIIACGVFRSALNHLKIHTRFPEIDIEYLQPFLHNDPIELRNQLDKAISRARERDRKVICLYGQCFPDIDEFLKERGIGRPGGHHCYDMLMGAQSFNRAIEEDPGTYFLEKELLMNFDRYCRNPLELDDPQMREWFFERYNTVLYIRQPGDPELRTEAASIADFLSLCLRIKEADYGDLADRLEKEINKAIAVLD
ncbi:MAG: DUF1638 domain-containing protein [Pseudomonadota bacterium]